MFVLVLLLTFLSFLWWICDVHGNDGKKEKYHCTKQAQTYSHIRLADWIFPNSCLSVSSPKISRLKILWQVQLPCNIETCIKVFPLIPKEVDFLKEIGKVKKTRTDGVQRESQRYVLACISVGCLINNSPQLLTYRVQIQQETIIKVMKVLLK